MAEERLSQRWEAFRPSKTVWFWSVAGAVVATMVIGFTLGGWTTGGTAGEMAKDAARDARAELAANICVEKFVTASGAADSLTKLKEASSYQRDDFISDGGWAKLTGIEDAVPGAADLCAEQLATMDSIPARSVDMAQPANG